MGNGVDRVEGARLVQRAGDGAPAADACEVDLAGDARMLDCVVVALSALGLAAVLGAGYIARCAARPLGVDCLELTTVLTSMLG